MANLYNTIEFFIGFSPCYLVQQKHTHNLLDLYEWHFCSTKGALKRTFLRNWGLVRVCNVKCVQDFIVACNFELMQNKVMVNKYSYR